MSKGKRESAEGLDHVVILVDNLERAAETYCRLGFSLTPRASHGDEIGTANHLMVFGNDYIELLGVMQKTPGNMPFRAALASGEGAKMLAMASRDAEKTRTELCAKGYTPMPSIAFSRKGWINGDEEVDVAFCVTLLPFGPQEIGLFFCEHRTPGNTYHPSLQHHENGALGFGEIEIEAPGNAITAQRIAGIIGGDAILEDSGMEVRHGHTCLKVREVKSAEAERIVRLSIRSTSIDKAQDYLEIQGIPFQKTADTLVVPSGYACGVEIAFVSEC